MAGFIDKFINSMRNTDDDYEDENYDTEELEYEDEDEDEVEEEDVPRRKFFSREKAVESMERQESQRSRRDENVVSIHSNPKNMEVNMIRASSVEDGREICDMLMSGRAVVINLENIDTEVAQRIIDFTSGACYTMEGNLQKISDSIFIASPKNVELSGDFQEMLSSDSNSMTGHDF